MERNNNKREAFDICVIIHTDILNINRSVHVPRAFIVHHINNRCGCVDHLLPSLHTLALTARAEDGDRMSTLRKGGLNTLILHQHPPTYRQRNSVRIEEEEEADGERTPSCF